MSGARRRLCQIDGNFPCGERRLVDVISAKDGQDWTQPSNKSRPLLHLSVDPKSRSQWREVCVHKHLLLWLLLTTIVLLCFYLDGRVPLPALRRLPVVGFPGLGLEGLVLLLGHLHHCVFGLLQLGALLGGALPSPAHLNTAR